MNSVQSSLCLVEEMPVPVEGSVSRVTAGVQYCTGNPKSPTTASIQDSLLLMRHEDEAILQRTAAHEPSKVYASLNSSTAVSARSYTFASLNPAAEASAICSSTDRSSALRRIHMFRSCWYLRLLPAPKFGSIGSGAISICTCFSSGRRFAPVIT